MTHQRKVLHVPATANAGREVAQLRHVLGLVEQIAGRERSGPDASAALDEGAHITAAYEQAMPILQRRFDTLAAETSAWAAVAVEALLAAENPRQPPKAPAGRLALELEEALREMTGMFRR